MSPVDRPPLRGREKEKNGATVQETEEVGTRIDNLLCLSG
jgi:hypothetical protein